MAGADVVGVLGAPTPVAAASADYAPYPSAGAGTSFVDHSAALAGVADPDWYESNIPFVDLPDAEIESTYYYRWRTFKEALKYTGPDDGWIVSEFLGPVGYSGPGGGISAAAGHHIYEGRWLRDQRYVDDYVDYWLTGSGAGAKPATDGLNKETTDWAHQYSFWVADAVLARAKVSGDLTEATALLPELERQWQGWAPQFNEELGLYWQAPVWDAMEFTASSYQSDDPYHGGEGYRPTLNAYQYGDAMAIAELARLTGDEATAAQYEASASALQSAQEKLLWDPSDQFYKHVMRDDNPAGTQIADREQIGYVPWYFHMAPAENDAAWAQLLDPQGFKAPYGPTTVERRSPYFMKDADAGCCRWSGPSWPYATSQTLTALGNLLTDYPEQEYVTADDFSDLLHEYAMTQRKNGVPYVAEAHDPDQDRWLYDGANHSEDYNHSTFNDIVLSTLIGIRAQDDDSVRIDPQVSDDWDHFAAENVPYHGHNLTVLWDEDGSHYGAGAGMQIFEDGVRIHSQPDLGDVTVAVSPASSGAAQLPAEQDDAANQSAIGYPEASASYSWRTDPPSKATDGQEFQLDVPATRWTTYQTPNATDWLQVDFGVDTSVSDIRTVFYDDGGGVKLPTSYDVEYRSPDGEWAALPGQTKTPSQPVGGAINRITLDAPVVTDAIRLVGTNVPGSGFGVTSFGSWQHLDDGLTASIDRAADGYVAVQPGRAATVTTRLTNADDGLVVSEELYAPEGWTVARQSPSLVGAAAGEHSTAWTVTAPNDLSVTADSPLRYVVGSRNDGLGASARALARWSFDPSAFGAAVWDDDFSTDRLAEYTTSGSMGEPAPTFSVNTTDGTLDISSLARARGQLSIPIAASDSMAIIVEPREFSADGETENSLFLGSAGSPSDFALSWYNHLKRQGGINVVADGQGHGEAEGAGTTAVSWELGDRFASVITNGDMTTWIEVDGVWSRLNAAPVRVAVHPDTLADWFPALQARLDSGTIRLDRVTVRQGGLTEVTPAAVTFDDVSGTQEDTVTIPAVPGVEYVIDDTVRDPGRYPGTGTVTVTARATEGYGLALDATSTWSATFSSAVTPTVPPTLPTSPNTPGTADGPVGGATSVSGGSGTGDGALSSTGFASTGWLLAALALLGGGLALLRGRTRRRL